MTKESLEEKAQEKAATVTTINSDTVQLFDPAENVTDEDGNTWNGGLTETDPDDPERVAMKTRENDGAYIWYSRGLGAGAAAGKMVMAPDPMHRCLYDLHQLRLLLHLV